MRLDIRPTAAPALTGLKATSGIRSVLLEWDPCTDPSFMATQVWADTDGGFAGATLVATVQGNTYTHAVSDTVVRYYWIRATNTQGRSDGLLTGPVSSQIRLVAGTDIADGAIDLGSKVTGALSTSKISGLGALAVLNTLGVARIDGLGTLATLNAVSANNVSGLGALATLNTVDATTQVNNLGALAYASALAADAIGAGVLAAGVIYSGTINADKINAGTLNAGVIYAGTISASQINAGTLVADRISGGTLRLANGNFQVSDINGTIQIYNGNFTRCTASNSDVPVLAAFTATSSGAGSALTVNGGSSGNAINITGGANGISQTGGGSNWLRTLLPATDNSYTCGDSSYRWKDLYVASGVISTSDGRTKTDISTTTLGLDFINELNPVQYRFKIGHNTTTTVQPAPTEDDPEPQPVITLTPVPGVRLHHGLIAQEVQTVLARHNAGNSGIWIQDNPADPDSQQGLRYEELIAPLIRAVQELTTLVRDQQARIVALEQRPANV